MLAEGDILVASNTYISKQDYSSQNPSSLKIEIFQWLVDGDEWVQLRSEIHAGVSGIKSGNLVVSLSSDGGSRWRWETLVLPMMAEAEVTLTSTTRLTRNGSKMSLLWMGSR